MRDIAVTLVAPSFSSASAALLMSVPPESTMSSKRMQSLPRLADDVHHFRLARPLAALVHNGELGVDALASARARTTPPTSGDTTIVWHCGSAPSRPGHHGHGEQVVGGDVEEALDLAGMQVERQNAVGAGLVMRFATSWPRSACARGAAVLPRISRNRGSPP
jgi:hypothetical protein